MAAYVLHVSYPAGSFLLEAPLMALGFRHEVTDWLDLAAWLVTGVLLFVMMPVSLRWLAALILLGSVYVGMFTNGGTDVLFLPFLVVAVWRWDRFATGRGAGLAGWLGPICLGLACSIKQTPWFCVPFLVVGVALEARRSGRGIGIGTGARYLAATVAVFVVVNLPFIVWSPGPWARGIVLPLTKGLVADGQGAVTLALHGLTGGVLLPLLSVAAFLVFVALMVAFVLWYPRMKRVWLLLLPVVLFVPGRSLTSYLIDFFPAAIVAAVTVAAPATLPTSVERSPGAARRWLQGGAVAVPLAAAVAVAVVAFTSAPLTLEVQGFRTSNQTQSLDAVTVTVRNLTDQTVIPHFMVALDANHPAGFWTTSTGRGQVATRSRPDPDGDHPAPGVHLVPHPGRLLDGRGLHRVPQCAEHLAGQDVEAGQEAVSRDQAGADVVAARLGLEAREPRRRTVSMAATPTMNTTMATKNELPQRSCQPCSPRAAWALLGTIQIGAHQKSPAVAAAHHRPPVGRSGAHTNQARTGTTHTMWWAQVMGETSSPVVAHTNTPRRLDDCREAQPARATPATRTTRGHRGDRPGRHQPVVEPVDDGSDALVADVGHAADPSGIGGVLGPVGPRRSGIGERGHHGAGDEGGQSRVPGPGLTGHEQERDEDQRGQLDRRHHPHQHAPGQRPPPQPGLAGEVVEGHGGQQDVDLAEAQGEVDRLDEEGRGHEQERPEGERAPTEVGPGRPDRQPHQREQGHHVDQAPHDLSGPFGQEVERKEHQGGKGRVGERQVGWMRQCHQVQTPVDQMPGAHQVDGDVELEPLGGQLQSTQGGDHRGDGTEDPCHLHPCPRPARRSGAHGGEAYPLAARSTAIAVVPGGRHRAGPAGWSRGSPSPIGKQDGNELPGPERGGGTALNGPGSMASAVQSCEPPVIAARVRCAKSTVAM